MLCTGMHVQAVHIIYRFFEELRKLKIVLTSLKKGKAHGLRLSSQIMKPSKKEKIS
jgi:hypothetical protein